LNKTLKIILKKLPVQPQLEMFKTVLTGFIHPEHELCLLAKRIDWKSLEEEFSPLYGKVGRPSIPIRTIVGLLLLKQMYNLGDETVVERYMEDPYWQHFCGEVYLQDKLPFDPSDFVHFRHRIGPEGMEKIFKASIDLFDRDFIRREVKEVRVDTTVQEKNITFPTDRKLIEKVIEHSKRIARKEDIKLKRTFSSLRFQNQEGKTKMGITLLRYVAAKTEVTTFPAIPQVYALAYRKPSLSSEIVFEGLKPRNPVYLTPYVTAGISQMNELNEAKTVYNIKSTPKYDAGLDAKFSITNNLTMDVTVNTDFAQVEADDQ